MITLDAKVDLAFFLSLASFMWGVFVYRKTKKVERLRVYEKMYPICQWLLLYELNQLKRKPYTCENKDLELAVRQHFDSNSDLQFWGGSFDMPSEITDDVKKGIFRRLVENECRKHEEGIWKQIGSHCQSPVFIMNSDEAREKLGSVLNYVGENLSYFSQPIINNWHSAQTRSILEVSKAYESIDKMNEFSCDELEEVWVDDPYVDLLKNIRSEYKKLTRPLSERLSAFRWKLASKHRWLKDKMALLLS
jgi:hypothetical protein